MTNEQVLKMIARGTFHKFNDNDRKAFPGVKDKEAMTHTSSKYILLIENEYVEIYDLEFKFLGQFKLTLAN